jgi:hypothetical protein
MSADLQARVAELERSTRRIIPAREGADGWVNFIESRVAEESEFLRDVVANAMALMRNEILAEVKATIEMALARRIRGTHDPKAEYCANDIVAKDGGSFVAKRNNPGPLPGDGWQLMAKQGQRGIAGPQGIAGRDARQIIGWKVDRQHFIVIPVMSDGKEGPALELRALFDQDDDGAA